jgi:phosphatidylglycerol:prolipoprotein diacylglycerol transferase
VGGAIALRGERLVLAPVPVYSYGALLCVALLVGWVMTLGFAERSGLDRERAGAAYLTTAVSALFGSRAVYVLTNWREFPTAGALFDVDSGGLVAYGGFLGGALGSFFYCRLRGVSFAHWADLAVPSVALGLAITRLGCWLYGCDFGKPLGAVAPHWLARLGRFPRWPEGLVGDASGSPAWLQHLREERIGSDATHSLSVHPTQLYELLVGLALFALALQLRRRRPMPGSIALALTLAYGAARFGIELLRDDAERGNFGPHFAAHLVVPAGFALLALAFVIGPARDLASQGARIATSLIAFVPALAALLLLRRGEFEAPIAAQLSTSQWLALGTSLGAALTWGKLRPHAASVPGSSQTARR